MIRSLLALVGSATLCHAGLAQASRTITFQTAMDDGSELVVSLVDDDFDSPAFDGSLTFVGTLLPVAGSPAAVTIETTIGILHAGTAGEVVTVSTPSAAIGYIPTQRWLAVSESGVVVAGTGTAISTSTLLYSDGSTGELTIEGDFGDLETQAAGVHASGSLALALSQTLTMMARRGGGLQGGTEQVPTLANCTTAARNVCGENCVESVTYSVTTDSEGNVTGSSCSFECKDPCPE